MPLCASLINSGFCTIKILSAGGFLSIIESFDSLPLVYYKKFEKERKLNLFHFSYNCLFLFCDPFRKSSRNPCCDIHFAVIIFKSTAYKNEQRGY